MHSLLLFVALSAGASPMPKELAGVLPRLAGLEAQECGVVDVKQDPSEALVCAQKLLSTEKSFWVAIHMQGVDSQIWLAAARASDGSTWLVKFDSDINGGGGKAMNRPGNPGGCLV
jgi:hypothetical protein